MDGTRATPQQRHLPSLLLLKCDYSDAAEAPKPLPCWRDSDPLSSLSMADAQYAVVAYLPGSPAEFVNGLRRRFNPVPPAGKPHVTILPPRSLSTPLGEPLEAIRKQCAEFQPFEVELHGPSTFWPVSGVVYLSLSHGFEQLVQLHDALNTGGLRRQEAHPYVPHVTIAQELNKTDTQAVLADVTRGWLKYRDANSFRVECLFLVEQTSEIAWTDLSCILLGGHLAPSQR